MMTMMVIMMMMVIMVVMTMILMREIFIPMSTSSACKSDSLSFHSAELVVTLLLIYEKPITNSPLLLSYNSSDLIISRAKLTKVWGLEWEKI